MASIFGIIDRSNTLSRLHYEKHLTRMFAESNSERKSSVKYFIKNNVAVGVGQFNGDDPKLYINTKIKTMFVLEGIVSLKDNIKAEDFNEYNIINLYEIYKNKLVHYLNGSFNIFIYNWGRNEAVLFNSRFGMLPLFYYIDNKMVIFASNLKSIKDSGLIKIEWDQVTQIEHMLFNYPITENSFIKNVKTLQAGSLIHYSNNQSQIKTYWSFSTLLGKATLNKKDSLELLNSKLKNIIDNLVRGKSNFAVSLTGGLDGRLVLSYILNYHKNKSHLLYSFGSDQSPDIKIPLYISKIMDLNYKPFIIDENYLCNNFCLNAKETIINSSGLRNYKRTHYLWTMKQLSLYTKLVLSGNCGSNIFKFRSISPGTVISPLFYAWLIKDFKKDFIRKLSNEFNSKLLSITNNAIINFNNRMEEFSERIKQYNFSSSERYYYILLLIIERKYFGTEINSYNNYINNASPYINFSFVEALSETVFWGPNYPFNSGKIKYDSLITNLYFYLTNANCPLLTKFNTTKGISLNQLNRVNGKIYLICRKMLKKMQILKDGDNYKTALLDNIISKCFNCKKRNMNNNLSTEMLANWQSTEYYRSFLNKK
jgi:hypothetical protein